MTASASSKFQLRVDCHARAFWISANSANSFGMNDKTETGQQSRKKAIEAQAKLRRERAAEKLRENLGRRKQQVRARRSGQADETNGLPAAKMDES
ncbi:phage anti-repressor protein [Rhizobium sp. BK077]|nr:phage anti-repressor protein [Rhizobium sp. BK077]MBB4179300.1 phage anti-repressor protein [Rhizobium sp. BK109]